MKRGLVIGKFLPIHNGHIALINFAASHCDEVIVSMSYTPEDEIPINLRFSWMCDIFQGDKKIKPAIISDDFDDERLPLEERTRIWADVIRRTYPPIHILFSSERYGSPFARHLGAEHILFDQARRRFDVSASRIRHHPLSHWEYIPPIVRPFFVKKICFYGPESTGKTIMTEKMAARFNTTFVPEVATEFLSSNKFDSDDIVAIGRAHHERIREKLRTANKFLFVDTDVITTQIYARHYLGFVPPELIELEKQTHYDQYFLLDVDVPWVQSPLRDLGQRRKEMFEQFEGELSRRKIPFSLVKGSFAEREHFVYETLKALLQ